MRGKIARTEVAPGAWVSKPGPRAEDGPRGDGDPPPLLRALRGGRGRLPRGAPPRGAPPAVGSRPGSGDGRPPPRGPRPPRGAHGPEPLPDGEPSPLLPRLLAGGAL